MNALSHWWHKLTNRQQTALIVVFMIITALVFLFIFAERGIISIPGAPQEME